MEDIKKFEKYSQEDQKKPTGLKDEIAKPNQKIAILMEEIKPLRKQSKMYLRPAYWELILPVRFETGDGNKIYLGRWLPVNSFWNTTLKS